MYAAPSRMAAMCWRWCVAWSCACQSAGSCEPPCSATRPTNALSALNDLRAEWMFSIPRNSMCMNRNEAAAAAAAAGAGVAEEAVEENVAIVDADADVDEAEDEEEDEEGEEAEELAAAIAAAAASDAAATAAATVETVLAC